MENENWENMVSKTLGKHNLPAALWERICKIRSRPVVLKNTEILGTTSRPYTVLPQGSHGYIVDFPEAFFLDERAKRSVKNCPSNYVPVTIHGYEGIVCMSLKQLNIVPPYFDMSLADLAFMEVKDDDG